MECPVHKTEMTEYADDHHGISNTTLSPTVYCGSIFVCKACFKEEQQKLAACVAAGHHLVEAGCLECDF